MAIDDVALGDPLLAEFAALMTQNQTRVEQGLSQAEDIQRYIAMGGNEFTNIPGYEFAGGSPTFLLGSNPYGLSTPMGNQRTESIEDMFRQLGEVQKQQLEVQYQARNPVATLPMAQQREIAKREKELLALQQSEIDLRQSITLEEQKAAERRREQGEEGIDPNSPYAKVVAKLTANTIQDVAAGRYKPTARDKERATQAISAAQGSDYLFSLANDGPRTNYSEHEQLYKAGLDSIGTVYDVRAFDEVSVLKNKVKDISGIILDNPSQFEKLKQSDDPLARYIANNITKEEIAALTGEGMAAGSGTKPEREEKFRTLFGKFMQKAVVQHQLAALNQPEMYNTNDGKVLSEFGVTNERLSAAVAAMKKVDPALGSMRRVVEAVIASDPAGQFNNSVGAALVQSFWLNYMNAYSPLGVNMDIGALQKEYLKAATPTVMQYLQGQRNAPKPIERIEGVRTIEERGGRPPTTQELNALFPATAANNPPAAPPRQSNFPTIPLAFRE